MIKFNNRIGAGVLVGLAAVYMVLSLALGRSARAERAPELRADEAGLDVWRAAAFLVRQPGQIAIVDVRPRERFELYHVPGATSVPGADGAALMAAANGKAGVLIVADADKDASSLAAQAARPGAQVHFLKEGVRGWYLAFELPVGLFTDKPAPRGYDDAIALVKTCMTGSCSDPSRAVEAVGLLSKSAYEPSMLQGKKPAASGAPKKKITGGCGG